MLPGFQPTSTKTLLLGETLDVYCANEHPLTKFVPPILQWWSNKRLPMESVFRITWDLLEAVEYLEKKGCCHNDINAQNVMILRAIV